MRKQSEGLAKEYDRLLELHTKLQVSMPQLALLDAPPPSVVLGRLLPFCCRPFGRGSDCSPAPRFFLHCCRI